MKADSSWGWGLSQNEGIWKHGCAWAKPFFAAAPWVTLALLLVMFALMQGRLAVAPGVSFDLPEPVGAEAETSGLVAFVASMSRNRGAPPETLVFFDDARYPLSDAAARAQLRERLGERVAAEASGTLVLLVDRRINTGDVILLTGLAREAGVSRVQIAEKYE